jgi:hypothetical protein
MLIYERVSFHLPEVLEEPKKEETESVTSNGHAQVSPHKIDSLVKRFIYKLKRKVNKRKEEYIYTVLHYKFLLFS